jgi:hypothetical protein
MPIMRDILAMLSSIFSENCTSVLKLVEFDHLILDVARRVLESVADDLSAQNQNRLYASVQNQITLIKNIRQNDSLRPQYETIYNQCVVLLVSYFSSTMQAIFIEASATILKMKVDSPIGKREISISWLGLQGDENRQEYAFAEACLADSKTSFQDMKSISRIFEECHEIFIPKDNRVNDLILAQAARHAIVHEGGKVNKRMLGQLSTASPRALKVSLSLGEQIQFSSQ